jgi:hypothetical protein
MMVMTTILTRLTAKSSGFWAKQESILEYVAGPGKVQTNQDI